MAMNILGTGQFKGMSSASIPITLTGGQSYIPPSGVYMLSLGRYHFAQWYDPVSQTWRNYNAPAYQSAVVFPCDGTNYRIFNPTGTVVGGIVTNGGTANIAKTGIWPAGSSSTTGVTCTTTAGGSAPAMTAQFNCIVGGDLSTTVTVVTGGAGYTLPPIVQFAPPPQGGLQATGHSVLTTGAVSSIVVDNAGAGYLNAPAVTITNVPGDTGSGATATSAVGTTNAGKLVAITIANIVGGAGGGYTAVPTLTVTGLAGSPAVTAIMAFSISTTPTLSSGTQLGSGHQLIYPGQITVGTNTSTNPLYTTGLYQPRDGRGQYNTSSSGATQLLLDGGLSQVDVANLPVITLSPSGTTPGGATYASGVSGPVTDTSFMVPV